MTTTSSVGAQTTAAQTSSSAAGNAAQQLSGNFDTFLTLLTTQLKNQDPLSPLDTNQFTQQLVSFSGVEQAIQTNKNLESLLSVQRSGQAANAVSYIGRSVTAKTDQAALADGKAQWSYDLASPAAQTALVVTDASGKVVSVASGETAAGSHTFSWDGKDSAGNALPDGAYTLAVTATDAAGASVAVTQTATGVVDGVDTSGDTPLLDMGGIAVSLDLITGVAQPASAS